MDDDGWLAVPLVVDPNFDGFRLDRFLKARIVRLSRNRLQSIIAGGQILDAAGQPIARPGTRVRAGDQLTLLRPVPDEPPVTLEYQEIYRDESLLVIDKPAGLPVHPTARYLKHTLTALLTTRLGEDHGWELAHRLDRETSGVLLLGRKRTDRRRRATPATGGILARAFANREVQKEYLAICRGRIETALTVDAPLGFDPNSRIGIKMGRVSENDGGLPSRTEVEPIRVVDSDDGPLTMVRCRPQTGRQHQIRIHLALAGYPILGDKLYGVDEQLFIDLTAGVLSMDEAAEAVGFHRQALHAYRVTLAHPKSGAPVEFIAPWPQELEAVIPFRSGSARSGRPRP